MADLTPPAPSPDSPDRYHRNDDGGGYAPPWVQSVTLDAIADQRAKGWPDFHPEDFCHRCGQRNPVWHAESETWFTVHPDARGTDGGGILCPSCFAVAYWRATGEHPVWDFAIRSSDLAGFSLDAPTAVPVDRDRLGRLVREVWTEWAAEQPNPKPSWLVPWDDLAEPDREVDRRIGERLAAVGAAYSRVEQVLTMDGAGIALEALRRACADGWADGPAAADRYMAEATADAARQAATAGWTTSATGWAGPPKPAPEVWADEFANATDEARADLFAHLAASAADPTVCAMCGLGQDYLVHTDPTAKGHHAFMHLEEAP